MKIEDLTVNFAFSRESIREIDEIASSFPLTFPK